MPRPKLRNSPEKWQLSVEKKSKRIGQQLARRRKVSPSRLVEMLIDEEKERLVAA